MKRIDVYLYLKNGGNPRKDETVINTTPEKLKTKKEKKNQEMDSGCGSLKRHIMLINYYVK